jgi:hypothetical protein
VPVWEYMELEVLNWPKTANEMSPIEAGKATVGRKNLIEAMNRLGGKGWEAFNMESVQGSGLKFVYLRKVKG